MTESQLRRYVEPTVELGHDALFYGSCEELLAGAVPFLDAGLAAGEGALLVGADHTAAVLAEALGDNHRLGFVPAGPFRRRIPTALTAYHRALTRGLAGGVRRVRVVREAVPGDEREESCAELARFEAVLSRVLLGYPVWSLCAYDTRELPDRATAIGALTHPFVRSGRGREPNPRYLDPADVLDRLDPPGPDPLELTRPMLELADAGDLALVRGRLAAALLTAGVSDQVRQDFLVAVSEVVTNATQHGRLPVRLRLWPTRHRVVCTVTDTGPGFSDPFAGYLPPRESTDPRGLWLARQFTDQLATVASRDSFTVRLVTTDG